MVQRWLWGQPQGCKVAKLKTVLTFKGYYFRVVESSSLGAGHICLFEPDRGWLFAGQMLVDRHCQKKRDVEGMTRDLKRLISLQPRVVFCSGNGVLKDGLSVLESKIRKLQTGPDREMWNDAWLFGH